LEDALACVPYVIVRVGCEACRREVAYRLAPLAAKYGADVTVLICSSA
jgi:hypothetical protein